jgi:hypothetical protein
MEKYYNESSGLDCQMSCRAWTLGILYENCAGMNEMNAVIDNPYKKYWLNLTQ